MIRILLVACLVLAFIVTAYALDYSNPIATAPFSVNIGGSGGGTGCQDPDNAAAVLAAAGLSSWHCDPVRSIDFDRVTPGGYSSIPGTGKFSYCCGTETNVCSGYTSYTVADDAHNFIDSQGAHIRTTASGGNLYKGKRIETTTNGSDYNETTLHLPANYYIEYSLSLGNRQTFGFWSWGWAQQNDPSNGLPYGVEIDDNEGGGVNWFGLYPGGTIFPSASDATYMGTYQGRAYDFQQHATGRLRNNGNYTDYVENQSTGAFGVESPNFLGNPFTWSASAMPHMVYSNGVWSAGPSTNYPEFAASRDWYIWQGDQSGSGCGLDNTSVPRDIIIKYWHVYIP